MNLKVFLPFRILLDVGGVSRIVAETNHGFVGFWPNRLDCVAPLVQGILKFEVGNAGERYVALDQGILVKTGLDVRISTRNAVSEGNLGELEELVESNLKTITESEVSSRSLLAKMESEIIHKTTKFHHE